MARKTLTYIKSKFETNDVPTEQDFIDLIDTLTGKEKTIVTGAGTIDLPAETWLTGLAISGITGIVGVGTTPSGTEIDQASITTGTIYELEYPMFFESAQTIYITGTCTVWTKTV